MNGNSILSGLVSGGKEGSSFLNEESLRRDPRLGRRETKEFETRRMSTLEKEIEEVEKAK